VDPGLATVLDPANGSPASETASIHIDQGALSTRSYWHSALALTGSLEGSQGQPIAGAELDVLESSGVTQRLIGRTSTTAAGTFSVRVAAGPSRTVQIAYRAYGNDPDYAASASLRESVTAAVELTVTPRRTTPTGTILLSGRVLGGVPRSGVIVELLVRYRGQWEPFRTPRTNAAGRFRVGYQFQGATGRFPFRAQVPKGQAGYPYGEGQSPTVTVDSG
jgi:5-hydroxyisourate hydrolase-like protein (transthyretin family)